MAELRQREGPTTKSPVAESVSQVRAEFTSSWEAALRGVGTPPRIHPFLTRVPEADRLHLERELTEIDQEFFKRSGPASIWMGGTVDQKADTPGPEGLATIDSVRQQESGMPSCDPAATLERMTQDSSASRPPDALGLPNAAFSLKEGGVAAEVPASTRKRAGQVLVPGYEIAGELGRGGMGVVYKARQIGLNRWVALKMVLAGAHASQHQLDRFLTEAKAVADLQHPNIVQIYDIDEHDGLPFFSLEFVGGGSLDAKVHRKPQPPREAAHMVETLAQAMQYAHEHGVIHRDLKPANILLTVDGMPKITDFGLAKRLEEESSQTKSGTLMGTPNYMAPEQARGEVQLVGPLADVYTLGAILYELLTGRPPFQGATVLETVKQVTNEEPMPPSRLQPHVPRDLETICLKCLQKDMVKRYGSARLLADDLRRFLSDEPILARPVSNWERLSRWCRRNPRVAALVGTVALLLIVVAVGSFAFAYRISQEMAETERQKKIADQNAVAEKLAREEADRNADLAERQALEARRAQELASQQANNALDTVYKVVTVVNEKLRTVPDTGALRKYLVELVMARLDKISKDAANSGKADRTMGLALQDMGRFYEQMGMTKEQTEVFERSLEIFNRLIQEYPEEDWNKFNAAISYDYLGEIGREIEPDPAKLFEIYNKALEIRKQLATEVHNPEVTPFKRLRALAVSYVKPAALAMEVGDPARALIYARKALKASEDSLEADPKQVADRFELFSSSYFFLAKAEWHLGMESEARKHLNDCLALRQQWMDSQKLNVEPKRELARAYEALGDLEMEAHHAQAALEAYQKALEIFDGLAQKDRDNPELQWYVANVNYHLGVVYQALGNAKAAEGHFTSCLKTRQVLFKSDDKNVQRKIELMLVQARMGYHREAAQAAQEVIAFAPKHPGKLFQAACGLALCTSAAKSEGPPKSPPTKTRAPEPDYADQALAALRQAVASGFIDKVALEASPDLEPLRSFEGYRKFLGQFAKQ
jgi:eukaryotic-like serine/threonine-protein kinase